MVDAIIIELIGYLGGIFTMISFIPQIIKSYKTRNVEDVSLTMLITTIIAMAFWIAYGFLINAGPVIIMNTIFVVSVLYELDLKFKYAKKKKVRK